MKNKLSFAIMTMALAAAISVAVVSCKKETENALQQKDYTTRQAFDLRKGENVQAYLKDFRKRMTEAKDGEALSLNDAAWHLASLANLDYCNINVEYDNVEFDTLEMNVNVTDEAVLMSDLSSAYELMCQEISQFKQAFSHNNQNLFFVNMSINANGNAKIELMSTYTNAAKGLENHVWYFPDTFGYVDSVCYNHFNDSNHIPYLWNGFGMTELQRLLNVYEQHFIDYEAYCFFPTRKHTFNYPNYPDPYGSPFYGNSRVFVTKDDYYCDDILNEDEMCYCLDSYLGLGVDYIDENYYVDDEYPVYWVIKDTVVRFENDRWHTYFHKLKVQYGIRGTIDPGNDPSN